ncbi:AI-2E family transporter [Paenibacillus sp. JX-17]|uniref:AI-2E family transporter n=2 Tax=Paenibacillus lacisoli TaxID=3064525 RepID=A0ABT9CGU5_9BACL|nr:AI-2E family transporter [Paenibacillus sp. JX-17]MDO7908125.1 AI-2E family transporter [Paenibacillus sp. JX-17]
MLPLYKKYWRTVFDIALIVLTVYLTMFVFSKLYQVAAPVFLSFLVFICIEPLARLLHRKGMAKPFASAISVLLFVLIILGLISGLGLIIISQFAQLSDSLPEYTHIIQKEFTSLTAFLRDRMSSLPPDVTDKLNEYFALATNYASTWATGALKYIMGLLGSFSSFITNFGIAIILAFFLSMEIELWKRLAREKTPKTLKSVFYFVKNHVLKAIWSYIKAQMILVSITFVIVFVGLLILRTGNAFSVALVSAVFDILPLLGVPAILLPWAIYLFIVGKTGLAIGLLVLLAVTMLVRQLAEPKITGNSIGVTSAYLMLSFAMISLSIFGVAGLVLSPILLITLKELLQQGFLQKWIRLPRDEFNESPFILGYQRGPAAEESLVPEDTLRSNGTDEDGEDANKSIT